MPARGPFVPTPLTARVTVVGHDVNLNHPVVSVWDVRAGASPTVAWSQGVANAFDAFLAGTSSLTDGSIQWDTITVTDLNSATGVQWEQSTVRGGSGGNALPGQAAVVFLLTALRGRSYVGRKYWPPDWAAVTVLTGHISSAWATSFETELTNLGIALAALSPTSGLVVRSSKLHSSTGVTAFTVRPELARVRRRFLL